jgi:uncharacterized protein (TIGR02099 family)
MHPSRLLHHPRLLARALRSVIAHAAPYLAVPLVLLAATLALARLAAGSLADRPAWVGDWLAGHIGHPVTLAGLRVHWSGWSPELVLDSLEVLGEAGEPALRLERIELRIDPARSLLAGQLQVGYARVRGLDLAVVREADGTVRLRGLGPGSQRADLLAALLHAAAPVELRDSTVVWEDLALGLEPVSLGDLTLRLRSRDDHHRLEVSAEIPGGRARVLVDARGDLLAGRWTGTTYLEVSGGRLARWVRGANVGGLAVHSGSLDLALWGKWESGRLHRLAGQLAAQGLAVDLGPLAANVDTVTSRVSVARGDRGWHVALADLHLSSDLGALHAPALELRIDSPLDTRPSLVHVPRAVLTPPLSVGEPRGGEGGAGLHLAGEVHDLWLALDPTAPGRAGLRLRAAIEQGRIEAGTGGSLNGVSGILAVSGREGHLVLAGAPLVITLPETLMEPLALSATEGGVHWVEEEAGWRVGSRALTLTGPEFRLQLSGSVALPARSGEPPYLSLLAHLDGLELTDLPRYLPKRGMKPRARAWLGRAFRGGRVTGANLLIHGPLTDFPFDRPTGTFELDARLEAVDLDYKPGWPPLQDVTGHLVARGREIDVEAEGGRMFESAIGSTQAKIRDVGREFPTLRAEGSATPSGADALRFVRESPLASKIQDRLAGVEVDGPLRLRLALDIPLAHDDPEKPKVAGEVTFIDNAVRLRGTEFAGTTGTLAFSHDRVAAEGLRARVAELPLTVSLVPGTVDGAAATRLQISGSSTPAQIAGALGRDGPSASIWSELAGRMQGSASWQATVSLPPRGSDGDRPATLSVSSDLRGLAVDLPLPLGKGDAQTRAFKLDTTVGERARRTVQIRYGSDVASTLVLTEGPERTRLAGAHVLVGKDARPPPPTASRVALTGTLDNLPLGAWLDLAGALADAYAPSPMPDRGRPAEGPPMTKHVDLALGHVELATQRLGPTRVVADFEPGAGWTGSLRGEGATGTFRVADPSTLNPIAVELDHLALSPMEGAGAGALKPVDPRTLPEVDFRCRAFSFGGSPLGELAFAARRVPDGLALRDLTLRGAQIEAQAQGRWTGDAAAQLSTFETGLASPDLGQFLKTLGYDRSGIEGGKTQIEVEASWPGGPTAYSLARSRGRLTLKVEDGMLSAVDPGAVGRVFGLLSVQALPRRLTLDFRDLFGKGLRYRRIEGSFAVADGEARTSDLVLEGDAARIEVDGRIDLAAEEYDQVVTVTPRVSTTLPIAGALAGGPAGAVAALVAQTLFKDQIDRAAAYQYTVKGSWSDPVIERVGRREPPPSGTE